MTRDLELDLMIGFIDDSSKNYKSQKKSLYLNLVPLGKRVTWELHIFSNMQLTSLLYACSKVISTKHKLRKFAKVTRVEN